ncbi:hypothetical protein AVEN_32695-1 [Araneus ventricosus]|uniref:Uncharacterized protein n=1 Tax=Araneus ventricosus TaxID=182803 RepID=A0A4Y2L917_ARAVE|nr:hypothetical protein AVEN_32695-1 [Araneus ventricosus]
MAFISSKFSLTNENFFTICLNFCIENLCGYFPTLNFLTPTEDDTQVDKSSSDNGRRLPPVSPGGGDIFTEADNHRARNRSVTTSPTLLPFLFSSSLLFCGVQEP